MKKFLIIALALFSLNAFSQTRENWEYWNTWVYKPKAGMIEQFEKAAGKKTEKFNSSKDNLIVTFKVVTGANSGQYVRMMPWQSLEDYDRDRSEELKYWQENVAEYADAIGGSQRWARMKWGDVNIKEGEGPAKYLTQTDYLVKTDRWDDFRRWLERIGDIDGERIPEHRRILLTLISGGNWNLTTSFVGFNQYDRKSNEFDTTWEEKYNEKFGANSWNYDRKAFRESIEMIVGQQVQTLELVESMLPNMD